MRISVFLSFRRWSAGLACALVAGHAGVGLHAQLPPPTPVPSPGAAVSLFGAPANDGLTTAQAALLKARQALAMGDLATALELVAQARQTGVDFRGANDSPEGVEAMISRQRQLMQMSQAGDAQQFNQQAADFLLEQAEWLLQFGDIDTCETLVNQAKKFPVDFATASRQPANLEARIAARRQAPAKPSEVAPEVREVMKLVSQAQLAMDRGAWTEAEHLVHQAKAFGVSDDALPAEMPRPWQLELQIASSMRATGSATAAFETREMGRSQVTSAEYRSDNDATRNAQVSFTSGLDARQRGEQLYGLAKQAMAAQDSQRAQEYLLMAKEYWQDLDAATQRALQDDLNQFQAPPSRPSVNDGEEIDLGQMNEQEQKLFRDMQSHVLRGRAEIERLVASNPRQAMERMVELRAQVAYSQLQDDNKRPLLRIIDRDISEIQRYLQDNWSEIENQEANVQRRGNWENSLDRKYDVEKQIQKLVEDFNRLNSEQRFAEAEMVARQAFDLNPDDQVVVMMMERAKIQNRKAMLDDIRSIREQGMWDMERNVLEAAIPIDSNTPYLFNNPSEWKIRSMERVAREVRQRYNSESEQYIHELLRTLRIQGDFRGTLGEAISQLSAQAGVNIVLDHLALANESVGTNTPVNVTLTQAISLQSALDLIVKSVGLTFAVDNEVIKVTTRNAMRGQLRTKQYYIGDLIAPVRANHGPTEMNFISPHPLYNQSGTLLGQNQVPPGAGMAGATPISPVAMGQQLPPGMGNSPWGQMSPWMADPHYGYGYGAQRGMPVFSSVGAPQLGGITEGDFQELMRLIRNTIGDRDEWSENGGESTMEPFVNTLTLLIRTTDRNHDEIRDLLEKLRELLDVQIVVEVKFITLADSFFERIGVDFDFRINDNSGLNPAAIPDRVNPSRIVGRDLDPAVFLPTQDLDIGFTQNSFASAVPRFGGFDANTAANFGFAILSDIEVFLLIQASKGDSRTNIMQAPTLTMPNGQGGTLIDAETRPFVVGVIPVVGDFAVAQAPVVTWINDGTSLSVNASASHDRRFVRLSLVPHFTQITDVKEFTFDGRRTTRRSSNNFLNDLFNPRGNNGGNGNGDADDDLELVVENQGITLQQPVIAQTTISTVVNVPDGGTVLIGGVKRMSESRVERGVPFLSNIPYVNRLFKNVAIGRETTNLMMMVTPRILVQAEEEERQVGMN